MEIRVNGQVRSVSTGISLLDYLTEQDVNPAHVVIEVNRTIVERDQYTSHIIQPDDVIEILRFVGGG